MASLLIAVIYLVFIGLGLPDSLLGSGWPVMQKIFDVPSSYAGFISMAISFMTIISSLIIPSLIRRFHTKWILIGGILFSACGLFGFSLCESYWKMFIFTIPYGLGVGAIDSSANSFVAKNCSGSVMSFLHCFYGVGALISPNIMALALKNARWNQGYRWTSFLQLAIMAVCLFTLPLWKNSNEAEDDQQDSGISGSQALRLPGVLFTLIGFFAYCSSESTCFLWTPSYFAFTKDGLTDELVASFGSLIFGGLMVGRIITGLFTNRMGDRKVIRIGLITEIIGIILIMIPSPGWKLAAVGFALAGLGMGPVYPSIQHMAPANFGRENSVAVIGLQMTAAYSGNTLMPMLFGQIQQWIGISIMPYYMMTFALINFVFLELAYRWIEKR